MKKASLTLIFSLLALLVNARAAYPYFVEVEGDSAVSLSDSTFYAVSRSVVFPVNRYAIPAGCDLREELAEQVRQLDSLGYVFRGAVIRGAASPEGPRRWNTELSRRRAQALYDLVAEQGHAELLESGYRVEVPEDYRGLVYAMEQGGDPDAAVVAELVDRYFDSDVVRLKRELRALRGGRLWRRLLREYFPALRAAKVVFFVGPPVAEADSVVPVVTEEPVVVEETVVEPAPEPEAASEAAVPRIVKVPRREFLSVKTNLLYDFAYMPGYDRFCPIPNVAVEYYPLHGHFTYGASFDCAWWRHYDDHKFFQVRQYRLESRYYLRSGDVALNPAGAGAAYRGVYFQAYVNTGLYSICFSANRGWEGEGVGGGLGAGYVLPLSRDGHWRLDFGLTAGYLWTKYDPYQWECPVDHNEHDHKYYYKTTLGPSLFKQRQHRFNWIGPTSIYVTISYDLLYRKNRGRGASFKPDEIVDF